MRLTLRERAGILDALPTNANWDELRVVHELRQMMSPSADELQAWRDDPSIAFTVQPDGRGSVWQNDEATGAEFDIKPVMSKIIVDSLTRLGSEKKLREEHYAACLKFLDGEAKE